MKQAKVYCEITCISCGSLMVGSGYYHNKTIISRLKDRAKCNGWKWSDSLCGNVCPVCQKENEVKD